MTDPWKMVSQPDEVDVVAPDGAVRCTVMAYYSGSQFVVDDMTADVRPGDEIRRLLPNGNEEAFEVLDPKFFKKNFFSAHYQIKIGRPAIHKKHSGGNYDIRVSGQNSRVNIQSNDHSTNIVREGDVFNELHSALDRGIAEPDERAKMNALLDEMKNAPTKESLGQRYQAFVASAANHMAIIAPFLPALTNLLNSTAS